MNLTRLLQSCLAILTLAVISSCAVSPEVQSKMDQYARTIPTCRTDLDCQVKWDVAARWARENSDFGIRAISDTRIMATSNILSTSGMGVIVERVATSGGEYQLTVDVECFSAYGCPDVWDTMNDFNQTVNTSN